VDTKYGGGKGNTTTDVPPGPGLELSQGYSDVFKKIDQVHYLWLRPHPTAIFRQAPFQCAPKAEVESASQRQDIGRGWYEALRAETLLDELCE